MAKLLVAPFKNDLAATAANPVLIRTPVTTGYQVVTGVSAVDKVLTPLYPADLEANTESYISLTLEPVFGVGVVGPGGNTSFPDLTGVVTGYQLRTAILDTYAGYNLVLSTIYGDVVCSAAYRRGLVIEAGTNVQAYVFYMNHATED